MNRRRPHVEWCYRVVITCGPRSISPVIAGESIEEVRAKAEVLAGNLIPGISLITDPEPLHTNDQRGHQNVYQLVQRLRSEIEEQDSQRRERVAAEGSQHESPTFDPEDRWTDEHGEPEGADKAIDRAMGIG